MKTFYSSIAILLLATSLSQAQTNSQDNIYNSYDNLVSIENTDLFNGPEFIDLFLNTDGTYRYLRSFDYSKGSVVYMGQYYTNVFLKYDLLEDNLLSRSNDNLSIFNIKLIPEFVTEFKLHNLHFFKLHYLGKDEFFELAYQGKIINLYTKHKKKQRSRALKSGVQYSFKPINFYIVASEGELYQVESKRDFTKEFPKLKSEIDDFYKRYKELYKQDRDTFMKKLVADLDKHLAKNSEVKLN